MRTVEERQNEENPTPKAPTQKRKIKLAHSAPMLPKPYYGTIVENQGVLIKPSVDASDGELHMRNNFNHIASNMEAFIQAAYKDSDFVKQVFRPRNFGLMSKNNFGVTAHL